MSYGFRNPLEFHNIYLAYDVTPFLRYLKDTYGLLENETHPIWSRWENIMVEKMKKWLEEKNISWNEGDYAIGVDYTDERIWDGNDQGEGFFMEESVATYDDKGEFVSWTSSTDIDKEYGEKSKLQKGYLQWALDQIIMEIEKEPFHIKNPYRYGTPDNSPPMWIRISWESLGLSEHEIDWAWRQLLDHFKPTESLEESISYIPKNKFKHIFKDLHHKTVKLPDSTQPLCTGGVSPTLSDGIAVQIYFPSSDFPYYVELDEKVRSPFSHYLETTYNLSEEEIEEVWDKYRRYICHT